MANYVCYPVTKIEDRFVFDVVVPTGATYHAGQVVSLKTISTSITRNTTVFTGEAPTTIASDKMAIVINGGFEQLSDGRRPAGQPDFTQYTYAAGEVVTVIALDSYMRFVISKDAITEAVTGDFKKASYLYPATTSNTLVCDDTVSATAIQQLNLLAMYNFRTGGNFGGGFATSAIAMVL